MLVSFLDEISQKEWSEYLTAEYAIELDDIELDGLYAAEDVSYGRRRLLIGRAVALLHRFFPGRGGSDGGLSFVQLETRRLLPAS